MKNTAQRRRSLLAALILSFATTSAFAAEGEVLISQDRALQGGITPDDKPGFPITLSQNGRYKLVGDLVVPAMKKGIEVKAKSVIIDFNGFTMDGNKRGWIGVQAIVDTAIPRDFDKSISLLNGTITGFRLTGIVADSAVINSMRITENDGGGIGLASGRVLRSTISANRGDGIGCGGVCHIEGNIISGNSDFGLFMYSGLVLGNTITSNGKYGIAVMPPGPVAYGNNMFYGNNKLGNQVGPYTYQLKPNYCDPRC